MCDAEQQRCGVQRVTMRTNALLTKADVGQVRKTTFSHAPEDHVFGLKMAKDPEGAKEVTMIWQGHTANPHSKPGPDYVAMNKLAADNGLVSCNAQRTFRNTHPVTLKKGHATHQQGPLLPSDRTANFVYGKPASYRCAEEVRACGPADPPIRSLIQGAYLHDWVDFNSTRKSEFDPRTKYIQPRGTKATQGHRLGATARLEKDASSSSNAWKMAQFRTVPSKVAPTFKGQLGSSSGELGADACNALEMDC